MNLDSIDYGTIDTFIMSSSTPSAFMMKMMLAGEKLTTLDECVAFLVSRLFDGMVYDDDRKEEAIEDAIFKILGNIKKGELVNKYLMTKESYASAVLSVLKWMGNKMALGGGYLAYGSVEQNKLLGIFHVLMKFDKKFIPSLRDAHGNNMLMIFANTLGFGKYLKLVRRVSFSTETANLDEYMKTRVGFKFFKAFVVDMKCDPFVKNNDGDCFADFFSYNCLVTELGYDKSIYKNI